MKQILATLFFAAMATVAVAQPQPNTTIQVGQKAPDLAFSNPDGQKIKLSEINKGRYVLLDFWASWCRPCRGANPGLVSMYKEYSAKKFKNAKNGFTVVSVSLDQKKEAWLAAIKKDGLEWPYHMSDLGGWNSEPATIYGVQFIPQSFLLDPSGKVVGMYGTAEEAKTDIDKLVKK